MLSLSYISQKTDTRILTKAIETVKNCDNVNYVLVDINCPLKEVFKGGGGKFFTDIMSSKEILEKEGINQVEYFDIFALQLH